MKNYEFPTLEIITVQDKDIITTSPGTETPVVDAPTFNW